MRTKRKTGFIFIACLVAVFFSVSQNSNMPLVYHDTVPYRYPLMYPALVAQFYQLNGGVLFWRGADSNHKTRREVLKKQIDSCIYLGLNPQRYHYDKINALFAAMNAMDDTAQEMVHDRVFTDAALALCKDICEGNNTASLVSYDEVSKKFTAGKEGMLIKELLQCSSGKELTAFMQRLEPGLKEYAVLKEALRVELQKKAVAAVKQLSVSLNTCRWIHHFNYYSCIVVNIPSATLRYYQQDTVALQMKVVVGKPSTKTPRFAAFCNQVILYPYWNVPVSIAVNELLPKVKRDLSVLEAMNMQVVDRYGNVVEASKLNWQAYSRTYFPYRFRQSTGCDNSLGVMKFNITDPYSVYLHDTNNKTAFLSGSRFYSHGCIRLEKPTELGNLLLGNKLDTSFLQACYKQQLPVVLDIPNPVPVFVIYVTAAVDPANRIKYYKDVYSLLN